MRIRSVFQTLVAFIAVLVFSQPLDTRAQQEGTLQTAAKTAAERDVNRDIDKSLWFGRGVCVTASGSACLVAGAVIGFTRDAEPTGFGFGPGPCTIWGGLSGLAVGISVPSIAIVNYQATPPPERILGKSPAYVLAYTLAYKKEMRRLRIEWAAAGAATGCAGLLMLGWILGS